MLDEDYVTQKEFQATAKPMQQDIKEIKRLVAPVPAILTQVEKTNGTVADHTREIGSLNKWQQRAIGALWIIFASITVFGVYIVQEIT